MKHNAPKQHRSEETFERIAAAAARLFVLRRSVDVSVREICEEAGASRSSFYARFPDTRALVHVCYDRFAAQIRPMLAKFEEDWRATRPGGDDFDRFVPFLIERQVTFRQERLRLMEAFREGERHDTALREKRDALDRELMLGTLGLLGRIYPRLDVKAVARALEPEMAVITAAFRGAFEFHEWRGFVAPEARTRLVEGLADLVLRPIRDAGGVGQFRRSSGSDDGSGSGPVSIPSPEGPA